MHLRHQASLAAVLAAFVVHSPQIAVGAPLTPPNEASVPSEPEFAPRGRHEPRNIQYSTWRKQCFKSPGKDAVCRTSITGTWDTGQMAMRIDLVERDGKPRLQVLLPVGLYLPAGARLKLDARKREVTLPFNWCFSNTCIAAAPVSKEMIAAIERARTLSVEVQDTNLLTLAAIVPVDQFSKAYNGPPAETIEQVVDE